MGRNEIVPRCDAANGFHEQPRIVALREKSLGAHVDSTHNEGWIVVYAEDDDLRVGRGLSNPPHQFEPGNVRQVDVDDGNIWSATNKSPLARLGVTGFFYFHGGVGSKK